MNKTDSKSIQSDFLKPITTKDFLKHGLNEVAYVREKMIDEQTVFMIYAADGTALSAMDSYHTAMKAITHNDLETVSVH